MVDKYVEHMSKYYKMYPDGRMYPVEKSPIRDTYENEREYPSRGGVVDYRRGGYSKAIPTRSHYPIYRDPGMYNHVTQQEVYDSGRKPIGFNQVQDHYGSHIDKGMADYLISQLYYTDRHGNPHREPKWSIEDIEQVTSDWEFEPGVTIFDKWVAFNFFYSDTCKVLSPREALKVGYYFFFMDEDAPSDKIYKYLEGMGLIDD